MRKTLFFLLVSCQTYIPSFAGKDYTNNEQDINLIFSEMSVTGYAMPIEGFVIGLFICVFTYFMAEYLIRLRVHEKFKITMEMLHIVDTPLILLQNCLDDLVNSNLPALASQKVNTALEYAEMLIDSSNNIKKFDKRNRTIQPKTSMPHCEFSTYVRSIVRACSLYANSRHVQLNLHECSDNVDCKINECLMTVTLQHLLNKMIDFTDSGNCIDIHLTHTADTLKLEISNCGVEENRRGSKIPFIPMMFPIYGCEDFWTIRKLVRQQGGKITGYGYGKGITFQIEIPAECQCWNKIDVETPVHEMEEQSSEKDSLPTILLVMSDKRFSDYLKDSLSEYFHISVLDNPDLLLDTVIGLYPDTIIVDEIVNGISGDKLCFLVRSDKTIGMIPLVLLGDFADIESYFSHALSGANLLEARTERISKLRVDLRMVVENHLILREQVKLFLSKDAVLPTIPIKKVQNEADRQLLEKVNACIEQRINEHIAEKSTKFSYGVKNLCDDMEMQHDDLLAKIREYTELSIEGYIFRYRMKVALYLMLKEKHSPNEVSQMLCFSDYSHFGKSFKKIFHVAPSQFIKVITG